MSGTGQKFSGSLKEAIAKAKEEIRFPQIGGATGIWIADPQGGGRMIAKVWGDHVWVAQSYLYLLLYKETEQ